MLMTGIDIDIDIVISDADVDNFGKYMRGFYKKTRLVKGKY
jgi:hypothetical protein